LRPRRARGGEGNRHERLRRPSGARAGDVRRREPAVRPGGGSLRLGDRERQSAQLLRRGLEDRRLRDRRAAGLAAADGGRRADGGGLARLEAAQGVRRVSRGGPGARPAAPAVWRAGRGMCPDRAPGGAGRRCARARGAADHLSLARHRQSRGRRVRPAAAGSDDSSGGGTDMAITLNLPSVLAAHTGGARTIEASGRTLGEAVADVAARYPALAPRLRDKEGKPYPFVNFYLNDEDVR